MARERKTRRAVAGESQAQMEPQGPSMRVYAGTTYHMTHTNLSQSEVLLSQGPAFATPPAFVPSGTQDNAHQTRWYRIRAEHRKTGQALADTKSAARAAQLTATPYAESMETSAAACEVVVGCGGARLTCAAGAVFDCVSAPPISIPPVPPARTAAGVSASRLSACHEHEHARCWP